MCGLSGGFVCLVMVCGVRPESFPERSEYFPISLENGLVGPLCRRMCSLTILVDCLLSYSQ